MWMVDEKLAAEARKSAVEKIDRKKREYAEKRKGTAAEKPKKREVKEKGKKEKDMEKISRMMNNIGTKLKMSPNIENTQNVQLKFLRKVAKKGDSELIDDERLLGMVQCYHFFRRLCIKKCYKK